MQPTPLIAVHMTAALLATAIGPLALWARTGRVQHPRIHRAAGYAWVTLMLLAATSAIFIRGDTAFHVAGFSAIHLLILLTYGMLFQAFRHLARGNIAGHRRTMQGLYLGACVIAGAFTLLPGRLLGQWLRSPWFGLA